jgi:hypothetical protein
MNQSAKHQADLFYNPSWSDNNPRDLSEQAGAYRDAFRIYDVSYPEWRYLDRIIRLGLDQGKRVAIIPRRAYLDDSDWIDKAEFSTITARFVNLEVIRVRDSEFELEPLPWTKLPKRHGPEREARAMAALQRLNGANPGRQRWLSLGPETLKHVEAEKFFSVGPRPTDVVSAPTNAGIDRPTEVVSIPTQVGAGPTSDDSHNNVVQRSTFKRSTLNASSGNEKYLLDLLRDCLLLRLTKEQVERELTCDIQGDGAYGYLWRKIIKNWPDEFERAIKEIALQAKTGKVFTAGIAQALQYETKLYVGLDPVEQWVWPS